MSGTDGQRPEAGSADNGGTLITVAPVAGPIGHLLRTAIDAEQVGATRLHLPVDQPDLPLAVSALREQTKLFLTCDLNVPGVDVVSSAFVDVVVQESSDLPALVAEVARLVAANPDGVAISGRGAAALPVLLAALAAGAHVRVEAPEHDRKPPAAAVGTAGPTEAISPQTGPAQAGSPQAGPTEAGPVQAGPAAPARTSAARPGQGKDHAALVARASGLARIAGRPPMTRPATARLLGLQ